MGRFMSRARAKTASLPTFFSVVFLILGSWFAGFPAAGQTLPQTFPATFAVEAPRVVLTGVPFDVVATPQDAAGESIPDHEDAPVLEGATTTGSPDRRADGAFVFSGVTAESAGVLSLRVSAGSVSGEARTRAVPGVVSLLPPVLAIVLAILFRQVVIALACGIWSGALLLYDFNPITGFFVGGGRFIMDAVTDPDRAHIIVFSLMFGGLAGILSRSGGARGFAQLITRFAKTRQRGQVSSMLMAFVVFFDDYANVIIRGNLMRPITDGLRISREKLAFLTDTGAASVASTVIVSTWVGYEVGLIDQGLDLISHPEDGYSVFIRTIPYRFYPIFSFTLALAIGFLGRDFGPMRKAELRALQKNQPLRPGSEPATETLDEEVTVQGVSDGLWIQGLFPILAVLGVAGAGIWFTGVEALVADGRTSYGLRDIVISSDAYRSLLWASIAGCVVGILLAVLRGLLTLTVALGAWIDGLKSMVLAIVILVLAWSIGDVTSELRAADYLVQILQNVLSPALLPTLTFVVAGIMAFATGTSWATMAILMPLVIPLSAALATGSGLAPAVADPLLMGVIGAVLAGAVFGDHCSPISDTTVLSSMASACDHLDHVRTQLPYALTAGGIAIVLGILPSSYGAPAWVGLLAGIAASVVVVRIVGKRIASDSSP